AITLVISLEPPDQVLPSRCLALEDRATTQLEEDRRAVHRRDHAAHVRQHPAVAPPPRIVRPDDTPLDQPARCAAAFAVPDALLAAVRADECVTGSLDANVLV